MVDSNEIEELHCMCQEEVVANWRVVKVTVDYKACFSNGVCVGIAPEVFKMSDDDALVVAAAVHNPPPMFPRISLPHSASRPAPRRREASGYKVPTTTL